MAVLEWDKVGERFYETGLDHGVLYLKDGSGVPWNGLTAVEEVGDRENLSHYLDGVKYLQRQLPGDFSAKLKAFTYPEEFDLVSGVELAASGLSYYNQPSQLFSMSYRTRIGNDIEGVDHGYKIHILYNVMASPDTVAYSTIDNDAQPVEFVWTLSGTPPELTGHRPTSHISIDSRKTDPTVLATIEEILYGSAFTNPRLPSISEVTTLFDLYGSLVIVDNGDGTWTAIDIADQYITMDSPTEFTINNVNATYSDTETYQVSTTNP